MCRFCLIFFTPSGLVKIACVNLSFAAWQLWFPLWGRLAICNLLLILLEIVRYRPPSILNKLQIHTIMTMLWNIVWIIIQIRVVVPFVKYGHLRRAYSPNFENSRAIFWESFLISERSKLLKLLAIPDRGFVNSRHAMWNLLFMVLLFVLLAFSRINNWGRKAMVIYM